MSMYHIIIIDGSYLIRKGLASIIESFGNVKIIKSTGSFDYLASVLSQNKTHYVLIGHHYVNSNMDTINKLKNEHKSVEWILINHNNEKKPPIAFTEIIHVDDEKAALVEKFEKLLNKNKENNKSQDEILSEREKDVLQLVAAGFINKEIADKLFISTHTVITHRKNITQKLGIKTVSGLTMYAILNKLIELK